MSASTRVVISAEPLPGGMPAFVTRAGDTTTFVWSWEGLQDAVLNGTPERVEALANALLAPIDGGGAGRRDRWLTAVAAAAVTVSAAAAQLSWSLPSLPS